MKIFGIGVDSTLKSAFEETGFLVVSELIVYPDQLDDYVRYSGCAAVVVDFDNTNVTEEDVVRLRRAEILEPLIGLKSPSNEQCSIVNRISFLDAGGDDLLIKPVAPEEVAATVRARLRRMHKVGMEEYQLMVGEAEVRVDLLGKQLRINGTRVKLTAFETKIFLELVLRRHEVVSYKELHEALYQTIDNEPDTNVINVCVSKIRKKAKLVHSDAYNIIVTHSRLGYQIAQPQ